MSFNKFQKVGQFKNALHSLKHCSIKNILYVGTVKLHGSNAAIRFTTEDASVGVKMNIAFQSRNRDLSVGDDNAGFLNHFTTDKRSGMLIEIIPPRYRGAQEVVVYGEWCGGNIQKGIAVSQMAKSFVIFDVKVNGVHLGVNEVSEFGKGMGSMQILNIYDYDVYFYELDVNKPLDAQAHFSKLTLAVEEQCPVGKKHGFDGIGEGIVWKPALTDLRNVTDFCFKTKGAKHANSKVRVIAAPTPEQLAVETAVRDFVEYAVTERRLEQGIEYLNEMNLPLDKSSTGKFLSWVMSDIWEEEKLDIEKNNLTRKQINGKMGELARKYFFSKIEEL